MKIIGITGVARSGKDTLAKMLISEAGEAVHMSFAAPIREFISGLLGIPLEDLLDGPTKEQAIPELGGKSPRQLMQTLGTEWGREMIDPDLWIKVAQWRLEALKADMFPPKVVVFSDVRFDNEADMIRSLGGRVVWVSRPGAGLNTDHISEAGIKMTLSDCRIVNDAGFVDLLHKAKALLVANA
ncbi:adenylate kinase [Dyella marensis]|uniref:deoxynucleotide monophosphate kinase family protein n=1 Tax=Dyella marensis TaxID=500610 RepID=UPI0031D844F7